MAIDARYYKELKQRADHARKARDRAEGQLAGVMERLEDEFGCDTVEKAEKLAATLSKDADRAEQAYDTAVTAFEGAWDERIEG